MAQHDTARRTRAGLLLAGAAAAPLVAGRLLYDPSGADAGGATIPCPFRAATGLPCPLCGSTRAIVLAVHGDGDFLRYNVVALAVLVAALVLGLAIAVTRRDLLRILRAAPWPAVVALVIAGWAWTLTHRDAITG